MDTQQPYGNRKDEATCVQSSVLVEHEHRYRKYCEVVCNVPKLPEHTTVRKKTPLKLQTKPWEIGGADIFLITNETVLCIVDI